MAAFLTVVAEHCRQAEHSLQLAVGIFNALRKKGVRLVDARLKK